MTKRPLFWMSALFLALMLTACISPDPPENVVEIFQKENTLRLDRLTFYQDAPGVWRFTCAIGWGDLIKYTFVLLFILLAIYAIASQIRIKPEWYLFIVIIICLGIAASLVSAIDNALCRLECKIDRVNGEISVEKRSLFRSYSRKGALASLLPLAMKPIVESTSSEKSTINCTLTATLIDDTQLEIFTWGFSYEEVCYAVEDLAQYINEAPLP